MPLKLIGIYEASPLCWALCCDSLGLQRWTRLWVRGKWKSRQDQHFSSVERSSREGTTESALRLDQRTQSQAGAVPSWEKGLIPGEPSGAVLREWSQRQTRRAVAMLTLLLEAPAPGTAHYSRGWPELPSILNPSMALCLPSSHHSPFWHFSSWAPSQTSFFALVLLKEIDDKVLHKWREQKREVCVLRKGYVAWKSHTDPKKWRPNCDVPFSVVAPLCRCVSGIWGGEMRSVTGTAHFFIHFGVRERTCPWRGASCGVFPHPTTYLNTVMASCFITVSSPVNWAQQQNLLYGTIVRMESENIWEVLGPISVMWLLFAKVEQFLWSFIQHAFTWSFGHQERIYIYKSLSDSPIIWPFDL